MNPEAIPSRISMLKTAATASLDAAEKSLRTLKQQFSDLGDTKQTIEAAVDAAGVRGAAIVAHVDQAGARLRDEVKEMESRIQASWLQAFELKHSAEVELMALREVEAANQRGESAVAAASLSMIMHGHAIIARGRAMMKNGRQ